MKYGNISDDVSNDVSERSVSLRCANWLNSTPDEDQSWAVWSQSLVQKVKWPRMSVYSQSFVIRVVTIFHNVANTQTRLQSYQHHTNTGDLQQYLASCLWTHVTRIMRLTLQSPEATIVLHQIRWSRYTGHWWVGCYIWYSKKGTGRGCSPPRPLLAVPNATAHPSTASVPTAVALRF